MLVTAGEESGGGGRLPRFFCIKENEGDVDVAERETTHKSVCELFLPDGHAHDRDRDRK